MRSLAGKRYWLVGASEGLGRALAHQLSTHGVHLVLSARNAGRLRDLADQLPGRAEVVPLDVSDAQACQEAAAAAGECDGIIYCAGLYWPMAAQDWQHDEAEAMADVNFTGAVRVIGHVLPQMAARDRGHIVIIGSLSGYGGLPGAIGYAASKAGVMVLAQSLHADLRGSGVAVQLVNPGFIETRLTGKNDFAMPFLMTAEEAARRTVEHMLTHRFRTDFPFWFSRVFRWARILPDWAYFRLFSPKQ